MFYIYISISSDFEITMIKRPPEPNERSRNIFKYLQEQHPDLISEYLGFYHPTDNKGRYFPYDEFRHRVKNHLDVDTAWAVTKVSRSTRRINLKLPIDGYPYGCPIYLTPTIQKAISTIDRRATTAALEYMSEKMGEDHQIRYLLNDLVEDEAISSSQLEGAATTTLVAKDMLKRNRKPRSMDEKMIIGNFKMMKCAWSKRNEPLSIELVLELHREGVEGIDDEKYIPGHFRTTDDVVIEGKDGEVVHVPPPADGIESRIEALFSWVNTCHDDAETKEFIHPLVKAICLHFAIGFEHPFRDGNGRVARSLFYWFLFKSDYAAMRYIAISTLLKEAVTKYGKSYIHTESDEMDLTYFVDYQCAIIMKAVTSFLGTYIAAVEDLEEFNNFLWESGLYGKLNEKQKIVFQVAKSQIAQTFTAAIVKDNLECSYNTAASVLNKLVELKLFKRKKIGREWIYQMEKKKDIRKKWKKEA